MGGPLRAAPRPDGGAPEAERAERPIRVAAWAVLILGWVVAVWYLWGAVAVAAEADAGRLVTMPTRRTVYAAAAFSAFELTLVLLIAWPWRRELYASRLAMAVLALVTWFVVMTPRDLSRIDQVHRRWLIFMVLVLALAIAAILVTRAVVSLRRPPSSRGP